jgi:hypothetical protein
MAAVDMENMESGEEDIVLYKPPQPRVNCATAEQEATIERIIDMDADADLFRFTLACAEQRGQLAQDWPKAMFNQPYNGEQYKPRTAFFNWCKGDIFRWIGAMTRTSERVKQLTDRRSTLQRHVTLNAAERHELHFLQKKLSCYKLMQGWFENPDKSV